MFQKNVLDTFCNLNVSSNVYTHNPSNLGAEYVSSMYQAASQKGRLPLSDFQGDPISMGHHFGVGIGGGQ